MLESARYIKPYCCLCFERLFFGVLIMMADSWLFSIYHFHIVHSVHCQLFTNPYGTNIFTVIIFIHLVVCLTTGPKPLPKRALHIVRSRASSFKCEYPLLSLWSSTSFLRLFPCLPVTSISPFIFPLITLCRRQFLHKMWPIQLAFRLLISCRIFLCSLTLCNTYNSIMYSKYITIEFACIVRICISFTMHVMNNIKISNSMLP
jgi:hypothetical protein